MKQTFKTSTIFLIGLFMMIIQFITAQNVGIGTNTPDGSAKLDIASSDKGILIPRTDTATVNNAGTPATGLTIFQTTDDKYYYYNGTKWMVIASGTDPVFERNGTTIRQIANYNDDFILGRDSLPVNGQYVSDNFLFYDDSKYALRFGELNNSKNWSPDSIGIGSLAFGYNNKAKGDYSFAFGIETDATGFSSTAWGYYTDAVGDYSSAWGYQTDAVGDNSTAWGGNTEATGDYSTTWGGFTEATGKYSTTWGYSTRAPSAYETVIGKHNTTYTPNSTISWDNDDRLFVIGNGTSTNRHNALTLIKNGDFLLDRDKIPVNGQYITDNFLFYDASKYALRFGRLYDSKNWGPDSIGYGSLAFGYNTKAKGDYSTAWGYNTVAPSAYETVLGRYNTIYTPVSTTSWNDNDRLFVIGNGPYSTIRHNALTVMKNGKTGIGTDNPEARLHINSSSGEVGLRVQINGSTKLKVFANGSVAIGTNTEGPTDGLLSNGNIVPRTHKGADLGTDGNAWDDIYYDDLHNQGASAFVDREPSKEIINYPPQGKTKGDFDYKTDKGAIELDPESMPPGLADDNSLLTDEISTYNYKTNYEQQLIINKQEKEIKQQRLLIQDLLKRINALENKINKK